MDEDIRSALQDLRTDVRNGFSDVNKRIDGLVSKEAFEAEVRRLDAAIVTLRSNQEDQEHRITKEIEGFRATTRWAIGLGLSGAGLVSAIVFGVLTLVANGAA